MTPKLCVVLFLIFPVIATFFCVESSGAALIVKPTKTQYLAAQNLGFGLLSWLQQLDKFLQNDGKQKTSGLPASFVFDFDFGSRSRSKVIENPQLLDLLNYLTWLRDLDLFGTVVELQDILLDFLGASQGLEGFIYGTLQDVGVDVAAMDTEFHKRIVEKYSIFIEGSDVFWTSVLKNPDQDPEQVYENLRVFLPQIQEFLHFWGNIHFDYLTNLVNLCQVLLSTDAYQQVLGVIEQSLKVISESIDKVKALLSPPSENDSDPTNISLEEFFGFFQYAADLNMTSVVLGGLDTIKKVRDLRLHFNNELLSIFAEASGTDSDLVDQGRNLTATFQGVVEDRQEKDRSAWLLYIYWVLNDGDWNIVIALVEFGESVIETLKLISAFSVETIAQLEELLEVTAPEYQQRASDLVTQTLEAANTFIKNYFEVFKPEQK